MDNNSFQCEIQLCRKASKAQVLFCLTTISSLPQSLLQLMRAHIYTCAGREGYDSRVTLEFHRLATFEWRNCHCFYSRYEDMHTDYKVTRWQNGTDSIQLSRVIVISSQVCHQIYPRHISTSSPQVIKYMSSEYYAKINSPSDFDIPFHQHLLWMGWTQ